MEYTHERDGPRCSGEGGGCNEGWHYAVRLNLVWFSEHREVIGPPLFNSSYELGSIWIIEGWSTLCRGDRKQAHQQKRLKQILVFCSSHFALNSCLQRVPVRSFSMCVCVFWEREGFFTPSSSQVPTWCPRIKQNSDTVYLERKSSSHS